MAETSRSVSAAPLEIPVTIQGSRTVESSDQRELFVESTKTTLVFDNGAVLSLKTKISPGQCVFLRNEESGKEILCKVLESRQQGDSNYADLEFTVYEPDFWNGHAEVDETAERKSEAQKKVEAAVANLSAEPKTDPAVPASEDAHRATPEVESPAHSELAPPPDAATAKEATEPRELQLAGTENTDSEPSPESSGKVTHEVEAELAAMDPAEAIADAPEGEIGPEPKKVKKQKPARPPNFKARKIAAAVSVTAAVLVISYQVYSWRGRIFHLKTKISNSAAKLAKRPDANTVPTAATTATAPATSATTESAVKLAPAPAPPEATTSSVAAPKAPTISAKPLASRAEPIKTARNHQQPVPSTAKLSRSAPTTVDEIVPGKIISEPQPSMPPWAKKLDLDGVVQLDAVIDENGNIAQTTPLSGPPILQHAAQQAVALWIFQPATQDGKPVSSHMVLTVEFQR